MPRMLLRPVGCGAETERWWTAHGAPGRHAAQRAATSAACCRDLPGTFPAGAHLLAGGLLGIEALGAHVAIGEGGRVRVEPVQVLGGGMLHCVVLRHELVAHLRGRRAWFDRGDCCLTGQQGREPLCRQGCGQVQELQQTGSPVLTAWAGVSIGGSAA